MQNDSYYDKLPFTLPVEQSDPDFVILGTGLQECLIASHLTKIQNQKGLILDLDKIYGSCLKTTTIKQLHALNIKQQSQKLYQFKTPQLWINKNQQFMNEILQKKQFRGYNIDIEPNFFFGSSVTCQMLKQAQMDKYMDFRLVYHMLSYQNNQFHQVPLSKGKIFENKSLSLLQKKLLLSTLHTITKIYNKINKVQQDQNSTNQFDKDFSTVNQSLYQSFIDNYQKDFIPILLQITKKNKKIMNYLTYIICNYQYNYEGDIPSFIKSDYTIKGFLNRFGKFIKSCGIYGEGPYLYVDNGIGDIPQSYSRIASIFGSIFILHPKIVINSIQQKQNKIHINTNLVPQKDIITNKIYYGPTFFNIFQKNQTNYYEENILRILFICKKIGNQNQCPSIAYFLDIQIFENPLYLFILDNNSHSCPQDYIIFQFETILSKTKQNYEIQIEFLIKLLKNIKGQKFEKNIKYVSSYIRKRLFPMNIENNQKQFKSILLRDNSGIDLDSHFVNMKSIVGQHQYYFKKQIENQTPEQIYDDTDNLIDKLDSININKSQTLQDNENQSKSQPIDTINNDIQPCNENQSIQLPIEYQKIVETKNNQQIDIQESNDPN